MTKPLEENEDPSHSRVNWPWWVNWTSLTNELESQGCNVFKLCAGGGEGGTGAEDAETEEIIGLGWCAQSCWQ